MRIIKRLLRICMLAVILLSIVLIWMNEDVKRGKAAYTKRHPLVSSPLYKGEFRLYTKGSDLYQALFRDIQQARSHIYIHFFIIRNDASGKKLLTLLEKKAEEGVKVKLSADLLGSYQLPRDTLRRLKRHGVSFTYSRRTKLPHVFYSLHRRNHRRIVAIDSHISYIGGFNIGDEYLGKNKRLGPWRDYHLRITGQGAHAAEQQFLRDWQEDQGGTAHAEEPSPTQGTADYQYIYSSGAGLEQQMVQWLDDARTSITIASPYFIPPSSVKQALHRALKRGVDVRILVTKVTDAWFTQPPAYPILLSLAQDGADVYQYTGGFFHGKVILIDGTFADVGTTNWDRRSIALNDESNCLIYDRAVISRITQALRQDFQAAERVTADSFQKLPFWQRMMRDTPLWIQAYL